MSLLTGVRFLIAGFVCTLALALPYRPRIYWFRFVSFWVHLPFKAFGSLARWMLKQQDVKNPYE
jgi:hypothetical protein